MSQTRPRGHLDDDVAEIMSAQERNGSITVTIPKHAAKSLGIEGGDGVLVAGAEGEQSLDIKPASSLVDE